MPASGVDRGPTRGLVAADRTARDHRHPRLDRYFRGQLCHGKAVRRGLASADNGERGRRQCGRVTTHIKRLGNIRELQNGIWIQRITGMKLKSLLGHY